MNFSFEPSLTNFIVNHLLISLFLLGLVILVIIYKFFIWKMNNFKKIDIFIDSLLIIDYNNDLLTIKVADNIIIPS